MIHLLVIVTIYLNQVFAVTYIQGEETKHKFIKAEEVRSGEYSFYECEVQKSSKLNCYPLFKDDRTFRRYQLRELVEENERNTVYAGVADVGIIAASLFFGWILAAKASAAYYVAAGASLDGGVAAAGGAVFGTPAGVAVSGTLTTAVDALDPFVHRDVSIALEDVMDEASEDDLEDVEARQYRDGRLVIVEDVNFMQLKNKIVSQLSSL